MSEEFVSKKSLYSYNSEYSYKDWKEDKEEDNTDVFFELNCENGKRNISFKQAREFISNDYVLFDKHHRVYMSIEYLDDVLYKKYIGSLKGKIKIPVEDTNLGDLCAYLVEFFEEYDYEKDEEMHENIQYIFQIYLKKREKIIIDINHDIQSMTSSNIDRRVLEVLLIRIISNMSELCGNKNFSFSKRKFKKL